MRSCAAAQHTLVPNAPSQRSVPPSAWFGPLHFSEAHSQVSLASNQDIMGEISSDLFGDWLQVYYPDSSSENVRIRTTPVQVILF